MVEVHAGLLFELVTESSCADDSWLVVGAVSNLGVDVVEGLSGPA